MFTGIIEATGRVSAMEKPAEEWRLSIAAAALDFGDLALGDSISVNGVCLTVVELEGSTFRADVSGETMRLTTLGTLAPGSRVNLEKALLPTSRLGGHIVSGHVDGVGELLSMADEGGSVRMDFQAPVELAHYIAGKGSICIDGTSLTVNRVEGQCFSINVIPHTQSSTIIQDYHEGSQVNLEVDLISRYLERLISARTSL